MCYISHAGCRFAKLLKVHIVQSARNLYIRFVVFTGDAMGMNMVSKVRLVACTFTYNINLHIPFQISFICLSFDELFCYVQIQINLFGHIADPGDLC